MKTNLMAKLPLIVFQTISVLIIFTLLTGCALNFIPDSSKDSTVNDTDALATPIVEINFILNTPTIRSEEERIVLEVLDEVTGLPNNNRMYDMARVSDQQYALTLPFPTGTVIKYRYAKIGTAITREANLVGKTVRYRMFIVSGQETVNDILQMWQGDSPASEMGTITGTLTDRDTLRPLPDIIVSAAGHLTFTDANGNFILSGISPGVHNVLFYAMDGKYRTFQQGASIAAGLTTPIEVSLAPMPLVTVTFNVTAPNDALGVPIYMAGNLIQLGNTFTDLPGGMSIKPKRMPMLTMKEDGTFSLSVQLYAESDLHYKFTLGDGYWNAEQQSSGGFNVRQLIVPGRDVTLDLDIATWRMPGFEPVTFDVTILQESSPNDEKYIQLKTNDWTEPIPLWPLGDGKYLYIVFSPLDATLPLTYRFCRNEDCQQARNAEALTADATIQPTSTAQTATITLAAWENWHVLTQPTSVSAANIPVKSTSYATIIELTPEMDPAWRVYAPIGISKLPEIGAQSVIFSPQWFITEGNTILQPKFGSTPFMFELVDMMNTTKALGLSTGLFPQIGPVNTIDAWWASQLHSEAWWQAWFNAYRQFLLNYARIAAESGADKLVIGGKAVLPAFSGGVYPNGSNSDVPESSEALWQQMVIDIRAIYGGELVWATNAQISMDPLPNFIDQFDEIYVTIDSPLASEEFPSFDAVAAGFNTVIDSQIYQVYQSTLKPITIALAYPSVAGAAQGCILVNDACTNDGLYLPDEVAAYPLDLEEQVQIYNAILPIVASRDWITGISIRGYEPTVVLLDGSSSIAGKPALDVVWYWFSGLIPE